MYDDDDNSHVDERTAINCGLLVPAYSTMKVWLVLHTSVNRPGTMSQGTPRLPKKQSIGEQLFPIILPSCDSSLSLTHTLSTDTESPQFRLST